MARIGIDLGTTNTLVGMVYDDGPHVVPRGRGRAIPSAVHFRAGREPLVGEEAANAASSVVRSVKRLMGRTFQAAQDEGSEAYFPHDAGSVRLLRRGDTDVGLSVGEEGADATTVWPHEVSALILKEAKRHAEQHLQQEVEATVTVPAYFRDPHRAATLDAAREAGLAVVNGLLLDEPTAAALAFAPVVGLRPGEPALVVDWGGGTLDVTVLASDGQEWHQSAIDGHLTLGGDDLDQAIAAFALQRAGLPDTLMADEENRWALLAQARQLKESLSSRAEAAFTCLRLRDPETGRRRAPLALAISREEVEHLLAAHMASATDVVARCLEAPGVDRDEIRKILLVGGSSRIPAFRRRLAALVPRARLHDEVDPMHAVALGAASFANARPAMGRICPYGYALLAEDGARTDVIPPGTEVPTPEELHFAVPMSTSYPDQTVYRMRLVAFTEHRNGLRTWHEPRRLFAREMPASASGTRVDVELWLDDNKDLRAQSHVAGKDGAFPLQGRDEGPGELFSRVLDRALEAEAVAECNRGDAGGLVPALQEALEWARVVERRQDRVDAESLLARLLDLQDQVEASHRRSRAQALPPDQRARLNVQGWIEFWEDNFLPEFADVLRDETREAMEAVLKSLRIKLRTGAQPAELGSRLDALQSTAFSGELELAFRAYHRGHLLGVPDRLTSALREQAAAACACFRRGDRGGLARALEAAGGLLGESEDSLRRWQNTGTLQAARPDLVALEQRHEQVH